FEQGVAAATQAYLASPILARAVAGSAGAPLRAGLEADGGRSWVRPDLGRPLVPPAIERLGSIRAPTLVVVGEHDLQDFHDIADVLARGIPGARKVVMEGV